MSVNQKNYYKYALRDFSGDLHGLQGALGIGQHRIAQNTHFDILALSQILDYESKRNLLDHQINTFYSTKRLISGDTNQGSNHHTGGVQLIHKSATFSWCNCKPLSINKKAETLAAKTFFVSTSKQKLKVSFCTSHRSSM